MDVNISIGSVFRVKVVNISRYNNLLIAFFSQTPVIASTPKAIASTTTTTTTKVRTKTIITAPAKSCIVTCRWWFNISFTIKTFYFD